MYKIVINLPNKVFNRSMRKIFEKYMETEFASLE